MLPHQMLASPPPVELGGDKTTTSIQNGSSLKAKGNVPATGIETEEKSKQQEGWQQSGAVEEGYVVVLTVNDGILLLSIFVVDSLL